MSERALIYKLTDHHFSSNFIILSATGKMEEEINEYGYFGEEHIWTGELIPNGKGLYLWEGVVEVEGDDTVTFHGHKITKIELPSLSSESSQFKIELP